MVSFGAGLLLLLLVVAGLGSSAVLIVYFADYGGLSNAEIAAQEAICPRLGLDQAEQKTA